MSRKIWLYLYDKLSREPTEDEVVNENARRIDEAYEKWRNDDSRRIHL